MEFKDYYATLGVDENADSSAIKAAYRKLARKYHPDVSKEAGAEDKFKELGEAYEVLKDPDKRAEYDQLRQQGARAGDGSFRPPPDWESAAHFSEGGFTGADAAHFSDFFETIFGRGGSAHRQYDRGGRQSWFQMRGDDLHHSLALFLEEAYQGCDKELQLRVPEVDQRGLVTHRERNLRVKIPAGVSNGQQLRLKGQGAPGVGGGEAGDLYLELRIAPHPHYRVEGRDLYLTLPVAPWEAALGASVPVPTLDGPVKMKIPAGAREGQTLRLKGKGLPGSPRGDEYVVLSIAMPPKQTDTSRQLFEQLSREVPFNPRAHLEEDA